MSCGPDHTGPRGLGLSRARSAIFEYTPPPSLDASACLQPQPDVGRPGTQAGKSAARLNNYISEGRRCVRATGQRASGPEPVSQKNG